MDFLDQLVSGILVETAYGPPIYLADPFRPTPPGAISPVSYLKPKVTIFLKTGNPVVTAPYGDPGETRWPYIQLGIAALSLAVLYVIFKGKRR
jgi:hypothetical protein